MGENSSQLIFWRVPSVPWGLKSEKTGVARKKKSFLPFSYEIYDTLFFLNKSLILLSAISIIQIIVIFSQNVDHNLQPAWYAFSNCGIITNILFI